MKEELVLDVLSFSFFRGGAAKAAARFCDLARTFSNVNNLSADSSSSVLYRYYHFFKRVVSYLLTLPYKKNAHIKCSANIFSHKILSDALKPADNLVHVHWINNDAVSIYDFKKIPLNSILTLHDEWFYCGVEHYSKFDADFVKTPYFSGNSCLPSDFVSRIHYHVWNVKRNALSQRSDLVITCPSKWLANRARSSYVFHGCDVRVLHNPIDVHTYTPLGMPYLKFIRDELNLGDRKLILFGAVGGTQNTLKGFAELEEAFQLLQSKSNVSDKFVIGLFGGKKHGLKELFGFPVHEFGYIDSELDMAKIYSAAHVTLVPSKVESFGQIAAESQACQTPVIAFDTSGLKDVVIDGKTGLLAEPFSSESLAEKIEQLLLMPDSHYDRLRLGARQHVVENFSNEVIGAQYEAIVKEQFKKKQEFNK